MADALAGFTKIQFDDGRWTRDVYTRGSGPAVIVIHEMPGLHPLVLRFAERRSWRHAIVYGVACALIGLVGFGWLLRVDLPESPIERAFYSLVR